MLERISPKPFGKLGDAWDIPVEPEGLSAIDVPCGDAAPTGPIPARSSLAGVGSGPCRAEVAFGSGDRRDLGLISRPEIALVQWWRGVPFDVPTSDVAGIGIIRVVAPAGDIASRLRDAIGGTPPCPWHDLLAADAGHLSGIFAGIAGCSRVAVRLEGVTGDSCRRFHVDQVPLRLITTYAGPGTQWLIGEEGVARVHDVPTGGVALFKGRGRTPDIALLHRSPPIADTGNHRLVLVIDEVPNGMKADANRADVASERQAVTSGD